MKNLSTLFLLCLCITAFTQEKDTPIFKDGEAQIVEAFNHPDEWITHDLWVETEFDTDGDGKADRMHVDVTRPKQTDTENLQLPVIYNSSPYFAGTASGSKKYFWNQKHELGETPPERVHPPEIKRRGKRPVISKGHVNTWVPRGYIVVHSSSPGTGLSDGSPTVGGDNESLAPKAVIDWLCGRAKGYTERDGEEEVKAYWSTGKVGMTGTSYNGTIPLAAATTGVDGLEAIIPVAPNTSYYHYYRSNGLVRHPGGWMGEDIDVLYDFIHSGDEAKREYSNNLYRDSIIALNQDRITGDWNEFWASRDYLLDMEAMKAALFMSHGFNDWNVMPEHSYRIYKAAKEKGLPAKIFYHQGGHGGPPPISLMNKWFTHFLHGVDNGILDEPNAWIVREGEKQSNPLPYADYPNPDAEYLQLFLNKGGSETGSLSLERSSKQGKEKLVDNYKASGRMHAMAEKSKHRLLYASPELTEDLHISGLVKVKISLTANKPAANLSVWLVSLPWTEGKEVNITDNIITRGWADPQNSESMETSTPLKKGEFVNLEFDLQPDDQIIKTGQQIGLMIFSSDKDFTLWPEPGTKLSIDLDKTSISIPVVGGKSSYQSAITLKTQSE